MAKKYFDNMPEVDKTALRGSLELDSGTKAKTNQGGYTGTAQDLYNLIAAISDYTPGPAQTITYSATPVHNYSVSENGTITLSGDVTEYTLQNVPDGGSGNIELVQDATGGYGITALAHSGLTVVYIPGVAPSAAYIDAASNVRTVISYVRLGSYLFFTFKINDISLPRTAEINTQTGTTYTLQDADNAKIVTCSNASAITVTVPAGLTIGFNCTVIQTGSGVVSFLASGTTLNNRNSYLSIAGQYAAATLICYASNTFLLQGDLT